MDKRPSDIIDCALRNDFNGVDRALKFDPLSLNSQWGHNGITALIGASSRGLDKMVKHLLSKEGIELHITDDFGNSAFDHARPFPGIVAELFSHEFPDQQWKEPGIFLT
uniref:hypothetical protein n=1 Tax=Microcoleus sp. LEGE 07076 TaxID=915322 RepID=UPI00188037A7|nr:hypothetical protein [Microcoleus sp. LEGE 07076]